MTAIYRKRISLFKRGETEWRVEDEGLVRRDPEGSGAHLIWADVRWLRLRYNPSLAKPWMHIFTVATVPQWLCISCKSRIATSTAVRKSIASSD